MKKEIRKFPLSDFVSKRKEPKKILLKPAESKDHENSETNDTKGLRKLDS